MNESEAESRKDIRPAIQRMMNGTFDGSVSARSNLTRNGTVALKLQEH